MFSRRLLKTLDLAQDKWIEAVDRGLTYKHEVRPPSLRASKVIKNKGCTFLRPLTDINFGKILIIRFAFLNTTFLFPVRKYLEGLTIFCMIYWSFRWICFEPAGVTYYLWFNLRAIKTFNMVHRHTTYHLLLVILLPLRFYVKSNSETLNSHFRGDETVKSY